MRYFLGLSLANGAPLLFPVIKLGGVASRKNCSAHSLAKLCSMVLSLERIRGCFTASSLKLRSKSLVENGALV